MKTLTIKETYHDALFFASSTYINTKEPYHLTNSEYKVLLKMIHYSSTHEEITFQNKDIAQHLWLSPYTVKDAIEGLYRKGYLNHQLDKYNNRLGYASKRTIYINWTKLEDILKLSQESIGSVLSTPDTKMEQEPIQEEKTLLEASNKESESIEAITNKILERTNKNKLKKEKQHDNN